MSRNVINVAVIGQTGVGKSSLINYIFDEPKRETGAGKPVTEQGFYGEELILNGIPVCLIDSWGIEQGKDEIWLNDFENFLEEKDIRKPVNEWLHIAIYCISAASDRVQEFDIQVIQKLKRQKIDVVVALTKAALVPEETIKELTNTLKEGLGQDIVIVPVNSVEKTLMGGQKIPRMGLNEIVSKIRINYINMLRKRLPERIIYLLENKIKKDYYYQIAACNNQTEAVTLAEKLQQQFIEKDVEQIIADELQATVESYVLTISITLPNDEFKFKRLDIGKAIIKSFVGTGIGSILRAIHPILGLAVTLFSIIKAFNKKPEEIAVEFQNQLLNYLAENHDSLIKIILDALDSMEQQIVEAMQL